jgi:hypothetical protein
MTCRVFYQTFFIDVLTALWRYSLFFTATALAASIGKSVYLTVWVSSLLYLWLRRLFWLMSLMVPSIAPLLVDCNDHLQRMVDSTWNVLRRLEVVVLH